jgi:hypothetical protein
MRQRIAHQRVVEAAPVEQHREIGIGGAVRKAAGQHALAVDEEIAVVNHAARLRQHLVDAAEAVAPIERLRRQTIAADLVARKVRLIEQKHVETAAREKACGGTSARPRAHDDDVVHHGSITSTTGMRMVSSAETAMLP